ncbi:acyltransferase family protein [Noviherbaspirillum sp.]|uniref:acyltransferase family protein n=1 Tax=Noviherbaspirillum sp. TaxID=1926288 RepID=UPI002FE08C43
MTPTSPHAYRPDIDGLRAIAVLAVIAFHANAALMPGGFVGVDIFFVISGFLITGLIAKGMEEGNFSFVTFYTRRIKRIFPAYIVVALATLAVSSWLLIPNDYIFYTTSLAASFAFVSNVFFSMLSWGYFGQRTEEFPLLHTWSLSVEEQFYFIFPILLLFLYRHARKHLLPALFGLAILFVCISELKTGEVKSYFLLTTRAHELILGALTFFLARRFPVRSPAPANIMALLGMALMFGSLFLIHRNTPFPGVNSLYPTVGAALVIYAGQTDNAVSRLLMNRVMVAIGLISYSLYLWHWPIFSFLRYRKIDLDAGVVTAAVALSFLLAYVTWKFIEVPIRNSRSIGFKKAFLQIYLAPAMVFMSIGLYSFVTEGAPARFSDETRDLIASYSFERDLARSCSIRAEDYHKVSVEYLEKHCAFGDNSRPRAEVLLIGDSHANHFKPFIDQLSKAAGLKAVFHVQGGCFPTELQVTDPDPTKGPTTCQQRNADLLELVGSFKYVVLAGFWASEPERDLEKEMEHVVKHIVKAGAIPIIFKDNPYHEPDLSRCVLFKKRGWIPADSNCNIPYQYVQSTQSETDAVVERMQQRHPTVQIINPKLVMCDTVECATHIGNIALYKDENHINTKAAGLLGEQYVRKVGNPFGPRPLTGSDVAGKPFGPMVISTSKVPGAR